MNGKHTDRAYDLEWGQTHGDLQRIARGPRRVDKIAWGLIAIVIVALGAVAFSCGEAEAARRFVVKQSSPCANGQCAIKQQPVVVQKVQHVQQVVAQPVVHHAAAVVAQPVCAAPVVQQQAYAAPVVAQPSIHTQNNWYSVGQPLVQHAQLVAAARDAVAEQQFKATVQGSFQATVNGAGQALYQQQAAPAPVYSPPPQQPAPQWTPQWTPPTEPQPPAEPESPPTFSMTMPTHPVFHQHCSKCHANGAEQGGFSIENITGEKFWLAAARVRNGTMPPPDREPLGQEERNAVVQEMLAIQYPPL